VIDPSETIRDAMIAAMRADPVLTGIAGLGVEPGPGSLPQIDVNWPISTDWSTKTEPGRELRSVVTIQVAKGQRARLPAMSAAVERIGEALSGAIGGWRVASATFVRTRVSDRADAVRVAQIEHRIRVLAG
jgi:hypothetical protein